MLTTFQPVKSVAVKTAPTSYVVHLTSKEVDTETGIGWGRSISVSSADNPIDAWLNVFKYHLNELEQREWYLDRVEEVLDHGYDEF
ncbi:MAG: hypothetical protein AB4063_19755 [Crocosphaera sp.]